VKLYEPDSFGERRARPGRWDGEGGSCWGPSGPTALPATGTRVESPTELVPSLMIWEEI